MSGIENPYRYQYETVAASQTAQVLGNTGAVGDYIHRLIINTTAILSANVTLIDGATSIVFQVGSSGEQYGVESIEINIASVSGAWKVTTGAGCTVIAVGIFSA